VYKIITRFLSTISMSLVAKELHKLFQAIKGDMLLLLQALFKRENK